MSFTDSIVTQHCLSELKVAVNNLGTAIQVVQAAPISSSEALASELATMEFWLNRIQMYQELLKLAIQWNMKLSKRV